MMRLSFPAFLLLLLLSGFPLRAQEGGVALGAEIQRIEKNLKSGAFSPAEKHQALVKLARLQELSGNLEAAAKTWGEAAVAEQGRQDEKSLFRKARCLAAMGDWEGASALVSPGSGDQALRPEARYLEAQIEAFRSSDTSALLALLDYPGFAEIKPLIYFSLWKITGNGNWSSRLRSEYPESPEARIAAGEGPNQGSGGSGAGPGKKAAVYIKPSPLWLLMPGRASFSLEPVPSSPAAKTAGSASPAVKNTQAASQAAGRETLLQTGLFGREENARSQAARLAEKGFAAELSRRTVNGNEYWVVLVKAGQDANRMMLSLKDAGFESFPVE
ncbi:MAG: SPOR domain-containing protein [Treponema sp.]|jgi:hypothetical protein|nr:SPOR domain-containing protein [Treponema sp.]